MSLQIQQMQRLQLAGTLASGIAHDLNNQLTLVMCNLELALDRVPRDTAVHDSLALAQNAAGRCADMSRRLLYLGRGTRIAKTRMDVAASISEAQQMLECIKPTHVNLATASEAELFIEGDPTQLQQILINLGTNAFQAMATGGDLEIRAWRHDNRVNISVRDTGCGIPASLRQRIFQPFFTTHADTGGSGLGLSTVKSIVHSHGAGLEVESKPGKGTTFTVSFPACDEDDGL
jgi:two-component system, cell cycle sensor histidine kinase and response regulator CckA